MEKLKFEASIEITDEVINENHHKARLKVLHDGLNNNGSIVELDSIEDAKETIKNTPILAFIKRDEDGEAVEFGGHEVSVSIKEKDGQLYLNEFYEEVPIGVIPETNNAVIEEIDGKNYLVCDCIIWKCYSNEAYDMLLENGQTDVSCELKCKSIEFDENDTMHIKKFQFLGVTVIGVPPGMEGAEIDMNVDFSKYDKKTFASKVEEINALLSTQPKNIRKEEMELAIEKTKVEDTDEVKNKEVFNEGGVKSKEENIEAKAEFGLSIDNLRNSINSQLKEMTTTHVDYWGDTYECRQYWLETILMDDKVVVLEDANDWYKHYGVNYSIDGDDVVLDFDSKVEYIQEWRQKQSSETNVVFEREDTLKDIVLEKFAKKEEEISNLTNELEKLQEFKANYDKQVQLNELTLQVDEIVSKFSFEEDEISELKAKAINSEIDMATFELNLKALYCDKILAEKNTNFSKEEQPTKMEVKAVNIEKEEMDEEVLAFAKIKEQYLSNK